MSDIPEDDFSSFFSAALTGDPEPSPKVDDPDPEPSPTLDEDPAPDPAPAPVPDETLSTEPLAVATPDPSEGLRAELALLRAEVERLRAQPAPAEPPPAPVDPDTEVLTEFATEWPSHHKAVQAMIRQAVTDAVGGLAQQLKPTVQTVQETQLEKLHADIRKLEPKFDALSGPVAKWVTSIPDSMAGLRSGMMDALWPTGRPANAEEIAQVFKLYQAWNPDATPALTLTTSAPAATSAPAPVQKPARSNVRDILRTMAPVSSRPVTPSADPDEDDFGSNFAQALHAASNERAL